MGWSHRLWVFMLGTFDGMHNMRLHCIDAIRIYIYIRIDWVIRTANWWTERKSIRIQGKTVGWGNVEYAKRTFLCERTAQNNLIKKLIGSHSQSDSAATRDSYSTFCTYHLDTSMTQTSTIHDSNGYLPDDQTMFRSKLHFSASHTFTYKCSCVALMQNQWMYNRHIAIATRLTCYAFWIALYSVFICACMRW